MNAIAALLGGALGAAALVLTLSADRPAYRLIGTLPDGSGYVLDSGLTADDCGLEMAVGAAVRSPYRLACETP